MKTKKAQIVMILSNPIVLLILLIFGIGLFVGSKQLSILNDINWNGFSFSDFESDIGTSCNQGNSASSSVSVEGDFLVISATENNNKVQRIIETDISGADSIAILYDGNAYANCYRGGDIPSASASINIIGSEGGSIGDGFSIQPNLKNSVSCDEATPKSLSVEPKIVEFKNNFDGSWSLITSLGRDDLFIKKGTSTIKGTPKLRIMAGTDGTCSSYSMQSNSKIRIYNIVRKENGFAVCKADQFAKDLNNDGKIQQGECVDLNTLLLQHEEAFQESQSAQFKRLQEEQQNKVDGLSKQIEELIKSNQDVAGLKSELEEAKKRLADIEAKDKNVIATIEAEESFEEPSAVKNLWNRMIAWIKNIF